MKLLTATYRHLGATTHAVLLGLITAGSISFALSTQAADSSNASSSVKTNANGDADAAAVSEANNVANAVPGAGSTTASLPTDYKLFRKMPVKFAFYSRSTLGRDAVLDNSQTNHNATSLNAAGFNYELDASQTLSLRQEWNYTFPTADNASKSTLRDMYIGYTNTNLGRFAGDGKIAGIFRLYIPTGEDARYISKQQGTALAWFFLDKAIGKWEFELHSINAYYNQTQNSYESLKPNGTRKITANPDYEVEPWLGVTYNISSLFSVYNTTGTDNIWYHGIAGDGVQRTHALEVDTGMTFKPSKQLSVSASLYNYANFFNAERPFQVYADKDTFYRLTLVASI